MTSRLKRVSKAERHPDFFNSFTDTRVWEEIQLKEPLEGIVIGSRTLSNGKTEYDNESGTTYIPKEHFNAVLVAVSLRNKPFFVRIK